MKFTAAALPLLALAVQQVTAIALPSLGGDSWSSLDLETRHQHHGGGQGRNHFGFGGQGRNNNKNNNKKGGAAAGGAVVAAGAAGAAAAGAGNNSITSSTTVSTTASAAASTESVDNKGKGKGAIAAGNSTVVSNSTTVSTTSSAVVSTESAGQAAIAAGNVTSTSTGGNSANAQTSLTLDASQVQPGLAQNGQAVQEAGQVPSLTSVNNFINFCATQQTSLTNGLQTKTGSCNPTIMGRVVATTNLPSAKFSFPANGGTVAANQTFTISMNIANLETGNFVNAASNFFAAPCQVNSAGNVVGHSHVVVEALTSLTDTTPTNPNVFAFFKGLNAAAVNGALTAEVTGGLAPGTYRLASINTCANHQPILGSIAQHGSFDDMIYFTAK